MHAVRCYTTLSSTAVCQFLLIKNDDDDDDDGTLTLIATALGGSPCCERVH